MLSLKINNQRAELSSLDPNGDLDIVSVFETIQGEGPYVGEPCVFVRLAGCNLRCPNCDTDYTSGRRMVNVENLLKQVQSIRPSGLVVITGGEPFRQNLYPFLLSLRCLNYKVQIETNGRLFHPRVIPLLGTGKVEVVCSPKGEIDPLWYPHLRHLKYVLHHSEVSPDDGLPTRSLGYSFSPGRKWEGFRGTIWVQPMDSQDPAETDLNVKATVQSCLKYGYRLSLQTHKILGLP